MSEKTWISCLLIRQLQAAGVAVGAYKPVCSGAIHDSHRTLIWPDVEQLAASVRWTGNRDRICPQRFRAPVAPNVAAEQEELAVHDGLLASGLNTWNDIASHVVIEGAGGLLCPLSNQTTVADLAIKLETPLLIVAANRLGVINHTMLTVQVAKAKRLRVAGIILNDVVPADSASDESRASNLNQLRRLMPNVPLWHCHHGGTTIDAVLGGNPFCVTDCFEGNSPADAPS